MDLFSLSCIVTFVSSIGFGLFVYADRTKATPNQMWLLLSTAIASWSVGLYGVTSAKDAVTAYYWQILLDISAIGIPVLIVAFIVAFLNERRPKLMWSMTTFAVMLALLSFTPLFKVGVAQESHLGFFWIQPGPLYAIFPLFFLVSVCIGGVLLARALHRTIDLTRKAQIRLQIFAAFFGVSGGFTNFFPQLFDVYPFGNYFIILYIVFISYAVLRYKMLHTKVIATQLLVGALILVLLFDMLQSNEVQEIFMRLVIFGLTTTLGILLVRGVRREVEARQEVERLAKDLESANARLRELDAQKSEFLSIATHQLRGPLAAIRGHLSLLLDGSYGAISEKAHDIVQKIFISGTLMSETVNDFLNVSRIEQGRMQYDMSSFAPCEMVQSIAEELQSSAQERGLTLTVDTQSQNCSVIYADYGKIRHIFFNLIDNAIKYTEKGGITVRVSESDKDRTIRVAVADTGIGIAPEKIDDLFEKFVRMREASNINIDGSGLGLYVAKKMVEAHKGRIWVESPGLGKGSTFFVELPIASNNKEANSTTTS